MRDEARAPLFRIDPGWPFVIAGLLLLAAGILIPGHRELLDLRGELVRQETREQMAFEQLRAYDEFLAGVRESDPEVIRRLAMAHLNKIPSGEESLLLTPGMNQTVGEWIEASIPDRTVVVPPYPDTVLARWAIGPGRLWLLGAAATLLFAGFVLGPSMPVLPVLGAITARPRPGVAQAAEEIDEDVLVADEPMAEELIVESIAEEAPGAPPSFDLVETKSFPACSDEDWAAETELGSEELEQWRSSGTDGHWSLAEYVEQLPPEESVASCDDVALAFLDESDGTMATEPIRGAD